MRTCTWLAMVLLSACGGGGAKPAAKPAPMAVAPSSETPEATPASTQTTAAGAVAKAEPAPTLTMAQKIDRTAKALITAWNAHETDMIGNQYADNAVLRIVPGPDMTGRAAIKDQAVKTFEGYPDFKVGTRRTIMNDKVAIVEWTITATAPTKRPVGIHGVSVFTFAESGLIQEEHRYWDMATQNAQSDPKAKKGTFRPAAQLPTAEGPTLASKGGADEKANADVVNATYAAIDTHKADDVIKNMAPDGTGDDYTEPAPRKGTKAMKEYMGMFFKAVPDLKQEKIVQIAAGDIVATEVNLHGTMKGKLGPMKPTNKPIDLHFVDILQVKDGKIVHVDSYANSIELLGPEALAPAAAPAPAPAPATAPAKKK